MRRKFWNVAVNYSRYLLILFAVFVPVFPSSVFLAEETGEKTDAKAGGDSEDSTLRYRWEPNRDYHYQFSIKGMLDDAEFITSGACNLRVGLQNQLIKAKSHVSGTAFVVAPNGYLLTAAHVIDGATAIKLTLDGNTYQASVIGWDVEKDLAVIKIDAKNLKALPFADSEQVGLGQSIWTLGYPLSDVLGTSLKINSGMVSGINPTQNGKVFQLNATLNPGNSGGPILNETGNVVAVAIQRLAGRDISDVGLARPINDAREVLTTQGITLSSPPKKKRKMDGQAIVNASQNAIAYVEVEIDPMKDATKMTFQGSLTTEKRSDRSIFDTAAMLYSRTSQRPFERNMPNGAFVVSPYGMLSELSEDHELPFALGQLAELLLEPFDPQGRTEWVSERKSKFALVESEERIASFDPPSAMRTPLPHFALPSRKENKKVKLYDIIENEKFKILKREGGKTFVEKTVELKSTDNLKRPFLELSGKGEWVFNHHEGCLESTNTKYEFLLQASPSVSIRMPIDVTIKYLDPATVAANAKKSDERRAIVDAEIRKKKALEYEQIPSSVKVKRLQKFEVDSNQAVSKLCISNDGTLTALIMIDGKITLFDRTKSDSIQQLDGLTGLQQSILFSPDSQFLIACTFSEVRGWNLQTGETFSVSKRLGSYAEDAVFTADSRYVFLSGRSAGIEKVEIKTGVSEFVMKEDLRLEAMTLSQNEKTLILADYRKEIVHWNLESKQREKTVSLNRNSAANANYRFAVLSPSGLGMFGSYDHIDVLNLADASKVTELPLRNHSKGGLALSRDGRVAAIAAANDKAVVLWDISNNKRIEEIKVDTISSSSVALSADGRYVATVGYDKVVQVWEIVAQ